MKKIFKGLLFCSLVLSLLLGGCGKQQKTAGGGSDTVTFWVKNACSEFVSSYNDVESLKEMQKKIGINVEYIHPSSGSVETQFNILMASGEFPDIIEYDWANSYPGGVSKAYQDGIITKLNEHMNQLPNYSEAIKKYSDSYVSELDGSVFLFATLKDNELSNSYYGHMVREDWLEKLGIPIPETIDDWYEMLKAFKSKDPNGNGQADEIPYTTYKGGGFFDFAPAWGVMKGTFHPTPDGRFVYGSIEPAFKDFLIEMNKWYSEGLIDPEFSSIDKSVTDSNMANDIAGSTTGYIGSQMGNYLSARKDDPSYKLIATPWPALKQGMPQYLGTQITRLGLYGVGAAVTQKSKNLDAALKFLDYCYSDEGTILQNWGIEGVTYEKNGENYMLTDMVSKSTEGKSAVQVMTPYAMTGYGLHPKVTLGDAYQAVMNDHPSQKAAAKQWAEGDKTLLTINYPFTTEENKKLNSILSEIRTYEDEVLMKMVMGLEPISNFDAYVSQMKALGIDEAIQIHKTAYERYMNQ